MSAIVFAAKRLLRRPSFFILLAVCALLVGLASADAAVGGLPPAGVYIPADSEQSRRVAAHLTDNGFVVCDDPAAMVAMVERGELNCAAILPVDLSQRLENGELEGCVSFVTAPASYAPEVYRGHVAAALFREYAPHLAAESFGDPVAGEQLQAEYEAMFEVGYTFSFELLTVEGETLAEGGKSRSLLLGAAALLLWAALVSACGELTDPAFRELLGRLGLARALGWVALPGAALRALCALVLVGGGLVLGGERALLPPLAAYVLLVTAVGLILTALLPDRRYLHLVLLLVLLAGLALCPIYTDLALLVPAAAALRPVLPPYWLWLAEERPLLWLLLGTAGIPVGAVSLAARYTLVEGFAWGMGRFKNGKDNINKILR